MTYVIKRILLYFKLLVRPLNQKLSNEMIGMLEMIMAMALAGSTIVTGKILVGEMPVFSIGFFSLSMALIFMLPIQIRKRDEFKRIGKSELIYMVLQAAFGIVAFRVLTLYGLRYTSAISVSIITSTTPFVMMVLSALFLKEKITKSGMIAIGCAVIGLLLINGLPGSEAVANYQGFYRIIGIVFIGGAVVSESLLTIFRKKAKGAISSITNTTILITISLLLLLPFMILELRRLDIPNVSLKSWILMAYYGVGPTAIGYILWGDGAVRISAGRTGIISAVIPVTAVMLSIIVLKEQATVYQIIGSACVIAGIFLSNERKD